MIDPRPEIIRWENPPPRERAEGKTDWAPIAVELRAHPRRWALVHVCRTDDVQERRARSVASGIRTAQLRVFWPAGTFEAVSRLINREVRVYARYLGDPVTEE